MKQKKWKQNDEAVAEVEWLCFFHYAQVSANKVEITGKNLYATALF